MKPIATQLFKPSLDTIQELGHLLPKGEKISKKRARTDLSGRVEELLRTPVGSVRHTYAKGEVSAPVHTKYELSNKVEPISDDAYFALKNPEVHALVVPVTTWTDEVLKQKFELIARLYTGENLGIVLLAINVLLEEHDGLHTDLSIDFRDSLKTYDTSELGKTLIEGSRTVREGSKFHESKLALHPASGWAPHPSNFVRSNIDRIIKVNQQD